MADKTYLGDSVYAMKQNGGVLLYLDNGLGHQNPIFIEPEVFEALVRFWNKPLTIEVKDQ